MRAGEHHARHLDPGGRVDAGEPGLYPGQLVRGRQVAQLLGGRRAIDSVTAAKIKRRLDAGETGKELAREYRVSPRTIRRIRDRDQAA